MVVDRFGNPVKRVVGFLDRFDQEKQIEVDLIASESWNPEEVEPHVIIAEADDE